MNLNYNTAFIFPIPIHVIDINDFDEYKNILVKMFNKVSQFMKAEIETKRSVFLSLLEPIVIILMGGFIMLIVLAILIPIMQMNTLAI